MDRGIGDKLKVSIVIATYNRAQFLNKALEALNAQTIHTNQYEILVIDNNSTDQTRDVVENWMKSMPNLTYVLEPTPGANKARNTGWQKSRGEYIAYLDDDAIPSRVWVEKILRAFENIQPKPGIVGGKVIPVWESEKPDWIEGRLLKALSVVDYSQEARFLEDKEFLFSVNMSFQKDLLAKFGGFDVNLGRKGGKLTSNDEILIATKIKNAGYRFYYDPLMAVEHLVPSNRLTRDWFFKRYYQQGYSDAVMWMLLEEPTLWMWIKKLAYYLYGFVRNPSHIFHFFVTPSDPKQLLYTLNIQARIGYIKGLFQKYMS